MASRIGERRGELSKGANYPPGQSGANQNLLLAGVCTIAPGGCHCSQMPSSDCFFRGKKKFCLTFEWKTLALDRKHGKIRCFFFFFNFYSVQDMGPKLGLVIRNVYPFLPK